jgi:hypothetical protein
MQYSPIIWKGAPYAEIFSEILFANATVDKGLVRVIDNIKAETQVTTLSGEIPLVAYSVSPTISVSDNIAFGDATIRPVKLMGLTKFDMDGLRASRFGSGMKGGAKNMDSNEFLNAVLNYATPKLGLSFEKNFWNGFTATSKTAIAAGSATTTQKTYATAQTAGFTDGVISRLMQSTGIISVAGTTLTSNLKAEFNKIYGAIPDECLMDGDFKLFASKKALKLIKQANQAETYRDVFVVNGDAVEFLGIKIEFVPVGDNVVIGARATDLILGTDLLSDIGSIEVGKVNNYGDEMFLKAVMSLDSAVVVPNQKVLYA